jgi:hypothetical protein
MDKAPKWNFRKATAMPMGDLIDPGGENAQQIV